MWQYRRNPEKKNENTHISHITDTLAMRSAFDREIFELWRMMAGPKDEQKIIIIMVTRTDVRSQTTGGKTSSNTFCVVSHFFFRPPLFVGCHLNSINLCCHTAFSAQSIFQCNAVAVGRWFMFAYFPHRLISSICCAANSPPESNDKQMAESSNEQTFFFHSSEKRDPKRQSAE